MSWKLIDPSYTGRDAAGGTQLSSFDLDYVFHGQVREKAFRIGNTGSAQASFAFTASGVNTDLTAAVTFSTDQRGTYATSANVTGLDPNAISDTIWMKFTTPADAFTVSGTYLVRIDES